MLIKESSDGYFVFWHFFACISFFQYMVLFSKLVDYFISLEIYKRSSQWLDHISRQNLLASFGEKIVLRAALSNETPAKGKAQISQSE